MPVVWCRLVASSLPQIIQLLRQTRLPPLPFPSRLYDDVREALINYASRCSVGDDTEVETKETVRRLLDTPDALKRPTTETRRFLRLLFLRAAKAHCDGNGTCKASPTKSPRRRRRL